VAHQELGTAMVIAEDGERQYEFYAAYGKMGSAGK